MCYAMTEQEWEEYKAYWESRADQARRDENEAEPKTDQADPRNVPVAFLDPYQDLEESEEIELVSLPRL